MASFGKRDLEILLPDAGGGDLFSLRHTITNDAEVSTFIFLCLNYYFVQLKLLNPKENYKVPAPKVDKTKKVTRYFPGQKPNFEGVDDDEEASFPGFVR